MSEMMRCESTVTKKMADVGTFCQKSSEFKRWRL